MARTQIEHAPAKINLALHVTGRLEDGYHLIETLVAFTDLGDRITVHPANQDRFSIEGAYAADVPADGGNLVLRARDALRQMHPRAAAGAVEIILDKSLPVASGIGGGSSDAAATLRALGDLWAIKRASLEDAAAGLGADVPMCLHARPLIATGIGERLEPLAGFPELVLLLANPGVPVSTPDVFRALERRDNERLSAMPRLGRPSDLVDWLRTTRNDLEAPAIAIAPAIAQALAALRHGGAALARMSGSGATCFGLFDRREDAEAAAAAIRRTHPGWFVRTARTLDQEVRCDAEI